MGEVISFDTVKKQADAIEIKKSPEYMEAVYAVSEFIAKLPLDNADNDRLVEALCEFATFARHDAYLQGLNMGVKLMQAGGVG